MNGDYDGTTAKLTIRLLASECGLASSRFEETSLQRMNRPSKEENTTGKPAERKIDPRLIAKGPEG